MTRFLAATARGLEPDFSAMLLFSTEVRPSPIQGLGLFARELIPKDSAIWRYTPGFDVTFTDEEVAALPKLNKGFVQRYAFRCSAVEKWILCSDDARFMNHSDTPNTRDAPGEPTTALRDIAPGEEITCDYRSFDMEAPTYSARLRG